MRPWSNITTLRSRNSLSSSSRKGKVRLRHFAFFVQTTYLHVRGESALPSISLRDLRPSRHFRLTRPEPFKTCARSDSRRPFSWGHIATDTLERGGYQGRRERSTVGSKTTCRISCLTIWHFLVNPRDFTCARRGETAVTKQHTRSVPSAAEVCITSEDREHLELAEVGPPSASSPLANCRWSSPFRSFCAENVAYRLLDVSGIWVASETAAFQLRA